jgi:hypothetical protein
MVHTRLGAWLTLASLLLAACSSNSDPKPPPDAAPPDAGAPATGALVRVSVQSEVGVLLDEIPESMRDRVAADVLTFDEAFWKDRAEFQVQHANYRLFLRHFYYPAGTKQQLPLPPHEIWSIRLDEGGPTRKTVDGHDLVVVGYTLESTLLTDVESPGTSEPALAQVGGVWDEPMVFPLDPELVFQRTGYACFNEGGAPLDSIFEGTAFWYYDHTCQAEDPQSPSCHWTASEQVTESCVDALRNEIGAVETTIRYERIAWDQAVADSVRVGELSAKEADLVPLAEDLENNWLEYRYIPEDSCAIAEGCVDGPGWRRLLLFDGSAKNVGGGDVHLGNVDGELGRELIERNVFELSACHQHYHFSYYGDFRYGPEDALVGNKQAFCLISTHRYHNNEGTKLFTPYGSCDYQGIAAGWGDEYMAGLDCQWIDVTSVDTASGDVPYDLRFQINPDQFLCEGTPVLDSSGKQSFEETDLTTVDGEPIYRPTCELTDGWDENNHSQVPVTLPQKGSFINAPCEQGALGPRRDCGFVEQTNVASCTPGETVRLHCERDAQAAPQVIRFCETSAVLGTGVACVHHHALLSAVVEQDAIDVELTCPAQRDATEPSGAYSMYAAPLYGADAPATVTCSPAAL